MARVDPAAGAELPDVVRLDVRPRREPGVRRERRRRGHARAGPVRPPDRADRVLAALPVLPRPRGVGRTRAAGTHGRPAEALDGLDGDAARLPAGRHRPRPLPRRDGPHGRHRDLPRRVLVVQRRPRRRRLQPPRRPPRRRAGPRLPPRPGPLAAHRAPLRGPAPLAALHGPAPGPAHARGALHHRAHPGPPRRPDVAGVARDERDRAVHVSARRPANPLGGITPSPVNRRGAGETTVFGFGGSYESLLDRHRQRLLADTQQENRRRRLTRPNTSCGQASRRTSRTSSRAAPAPSARAASSRSRCRAGTSRTPASTTSRSSSASPSRSRCATTTPRRAARTTPRTSSSRTPARGRSRSAAAPTRRR